LVEVVTAAVAARVGFLAAVGSAAVKVAAVRVAEGTMGGVAMGVAPRVEVVMVVAERVAVDVAPSDQASAAECVPCPPPT